MSYRTTRKRGTNTCKLSGRASVDLFDSLLSSSVTRVSLVPPRLYHTGLTAVFDSYHERRPIESQTRRIAVCADCFPCVAKGKGGLHTCCASSAVGAKMSTRGFPGLARPCTSASSSSLRYRASKKNRSRTMARHSMAPKWLWLKQRKKPYGRAARYFATRKQCKQQQ